MANSDLWKDLGREFRALDPERRIRIQWEPINDQPHWSIMAVGGDLPLSLIQFMVLANRAGRILNPNAPSPLENVWFGVLRKRFPYTEAGANEGCILYVSEKSAETCDAMEYNALEFERPERLPARQPTGLAVTSIGEQIEALRIEADISQEKLAELVHIDIRNVQRHLANVTTPNDRNISRYQRAFHKLMNRQIVITKTP